MLASGTVSPNLQQSMSISSNSKKMCDGALRIIAWIHDASPFHYSQHWLDNVIYGEVLSPISLRQVGLKITEVLGHAGLCFVLWYICELRDAFYGDLPYCLMLHPGTDWFKKLFLEHFHLKAVHQPVKPSCIAAASPGGIINAILLR